LKQKLIAIFGVVGQKGEITPKSQPLLKEGIYFIRI
jgi:hypothetical protein